MKHFVIGWTLCLILMGSLPIIAQAQTDIDGDSVEDSTDRCPREAGPASNAGCPLPAATENPPPPTDTDADDDGVEDSVDSCPFVSGRGDQFGGVTGADGCPVDSDRDQIVDGLDQCPYQAGLADRNGCPEPAANPTATTPAPAAPEINLPTLPTEGDCQIATRSEQEVNLRRFPSLESETVGQLNPRNLYPALAHNGNFAWWRLENGWVKAEVVRSGGDCDEVLSVIEADTSVCPALDIYSPEELSRLEEAGLSRLEICVAAADAPDRICDEVLSNLTPEEMDRYQEAGVALNRLCLPENRPDAPCPLLGSLSPEQLARYEAAGVDPCGQQVCPGLAQISTEQQARLVGGGVDTGRLCLPPLKPDAMCEEMKALSEAELARYAAAGIDPKSLCTPADTLNIPNLVLLEVPLMPTPDANSDPNPQMFTLQAECKLPFTRVKLADSPYQGQVDIVVSGNAYWGTACDEIIFGNTQANNIIGGGGADLIFGYGGNDILLGGLGDDVIFGMNGDDLVSGTGGNDFLYGNAGLDKMGGGSGNDFMIQDSVDGDYDFTFYAASGLFPAWSASSKFWNPLNSGPNIIGIGRDYLSSLVMGNSLILAETALYDGEGLTPSLMKGGSGTDFMEGSALPDIMQGGPGRDYMRNIEGSEACFALSCNSLNGEDGDDFLEGAGNLYVLGDLGVDVVLPIFDDIPITPDLTKYFAGPWDVCFTIEGYPVTNFIPQPVQCVVLSATNSRRALEEYEKWRQKVIAEGGF